ncbi:hypothetical protein ACHAW5_010443 [Stephanodiscus triporus]|uniref:PiggyBac transposable element-derived protein 4 C-terminal zinc-ribbon domain-containing protein n=1 Tax=Stephanodiscus triporus TaxID=2934178 RepID=A0ABD3MJK3_9STRA
MDNPTPPTAEQRQQQQHHHHPPEELQNTDAAATSADAIAEAGVSVEESMTTLRDRQDEQARLLASMQSRIDELENVVRRFVGNDPTRQTVAAAATAEVTTTATTQLCMSPEADPDNAMAMATSDDDIDAIIESRTQRSLWPLKRRYCTNFTHDADLVRVRFHVSDRYGHVSVRIPKIVDVDNNEGRYGLGNKEGRLICRLCSGKTMNRNTSWMCATCLVPLCVDVSNGDRESSCHARWHKCPDLVTLNETLNSSLRERRTSRKRSRATTDDTIARWGALPEAGADATTTVEPLAKVEMAEEEPPPQDRVASTNASVSQID